MNQIDRLFIRVHYEICYVHDVFSLIIDVLVVLEVDDLSAPINLLLISIFDC